jgi:pyruvate formate lyase activating enzyme
MIFGGFQPLMLLDFPGQVACTVFTQGCNLRCGYCHNPQLICRQNAADVETLTEEQLFAFLKHRRGVLDGVVISGGEPSLQPDLIDFLARIKVLGFLVKLDTNGTNPQVLREALEYRLLDYVAMDVKHDPACYVEITSVLVDPKVLATSRDLLLSSGVAYEFRTTILPQFHDEAAIEQIARFCEGASCFVLQSFVPAHVLEPTFRKYLPPTLDQLRRLKHVAERFIDNVELLDRDRGEMQNVRKRMAG